MFKDGEWREELTGGTARTHQFCLMHAKPRHAIFTQDVEGVMAWLRKVAADLKHEDLVLNVAGPHESKCPGIQESTRAFVTRLIERLKQGDFKK